jgi:KDO2-lipid IV(A) lauroyltransferase
MRANLIRLFLAILARLPLRLEHGVGALIGTALGYLPNKMLHVTRVNLTLCLPELDAEARNALARRSLIETAKTVTEMGAAWNWDQTRLLNTVRAVHGEEALREALGRGRGVILATPHLGNWEIVGLYCSAHFKITSLYYPPHITALDNLVRNARERFGARLVPTGASGVRALYGALGRGEMAGILPDQVPLGNNGIFVPFFGIPAYTMTLLARLAKKTGAAVIFACAERLPAGQGFAMHFTGAPPDLHDKSIEEITAAVNIGIESLIRARPAQYQWSYKRLRRRPNGESGFY